MDYFTTKQRKRKPVPAKIRTALLQPNEGEMDTINVEDLINEVVKAKFMAKAAAKMKRQQQRSKFKSSLARLSRGEAKDLDTYGLIECVREGIDPGQLLAEKVSYSYDPRLDQNIKTCPVVKDSRGKFVVRRAYNAVTGEEGCSEPAQPKE